MNIAIILASGQGTRITTSKIPKQFIEINNKPVISYTIDRFITNKSIDCVVISCHPEWMDYLHNYLDNQYININKKISIVSGGDFRNNSIANAIKYIEKNFNIKDEDIILTHDAVRMFVSDRIISQNILECQKHDAINTVVHTIDTIVSSDNNKFIDNIPNRDSLYNGQTPQTFKYYIMKQLYLKNDISDTSDICKLVLDLLKTNISLVMGEYENFKITTDLDLDYVKKMVIKND